MKTKFDFPIFIALFILLLIIPGKDLQAQKTEINSGEENQTRAFLPMLKAWNIGRI